MESVVRRDADPLKKYAWGLIVLSLLVGLFLATSKMSGTGGDSVPIEGAFASAETEQSLQSLDTLDNPQGAPGRAVDGAGRYVKTEQDIHDPGLSSLYQAPAGADSVAGAAGDSAVSEETQTGASDVPADNQSFADAMAQVAAGAAPAAAKDDSGWNGLAARSGFAKPKANFGAIGLSRSGGVSSTGAQLTVIDRPFGEGGRPDAQFVPGDGGLTGAGTRAKSVVAQAQSSQSMQGLKGARQQALASLTGNEERASSLSARTFDAAGAGNGSLKDMAKESAQAAVISGAGVPENLKANDPNMIMKKEFEPPKIEAAGEVKDSENKEYMQQQLLMMILSAAISGIAGPVFGGIGTAVAGGMGLTPPGNKLDVSKVPSTPPAT